MMPNVKPCIPKSDIPFILEDIKTVLESGILMLGNNLKQFENEFSSYIGTKYAAGTSSAATTLQMLFQYYGVEGKEVIVPTLNFISVANAVYWAGGKPVFCDTAPNSILPSFDEIKSKVTDRTRGVVLVHLLGHINSQINEIKAFCKENNLFLVEDASHAHGSEAYGIKAGNFCDAAVFSFIAIKVMTTGAGGMLVTNNEEIYNHVISARHQGQGKSLLDCKTIGGGWHLPEMSAVLGRWQLKHLEEWVQRRNIIARKYDDIFKDITDLHLIPPLVGRSAYYKYEVLLSKDVNKQEFINGVESKGVKCGQVYNPPIHLQPIYMKKFGYTYGMFPNAEDVASRIVALPLFVEMTDDQQNEVINAVKEVLKC